MQEHHDADLTTAAPAGKPDPRQEEQALYGSQTANAPRKSVQIGLSGPYDWSNSQIRDEVLIAKVLERHKFEDVVRLCAYYGAPKVRQVFWQRQFGPITRASVARMLDNIEAAIQRGGRHAQT